MEGRSALPPNNRRLGSVNDPEAVAWADGFGGDSA